MIVRTLKLKPTKAQEATLNGWLWNLTGVWNWAIKKIEHDAHDGIYHSGFDFQNLVSNHSKRLEIPSHTLQGLLSQAHAAWQRCFKKTAKKPHLKGARKPLRSIPFPDPLRPPKNNRIGLPSLGSVRYHAQALPEGKIKCARIIKKASGWYLLLFLDAEHRFPVKDTAEAVGIDTGFKSLLTLSNSVVFENPRELRKGEQRIAQAQRARDKKLTARLQERQANRRNDRNHKISRKLVEDYKTICYSDDNFKGMAKRFGKSVGEAALGDLLGKVSYKCHTGGRKLIKVNSRNTTMTCSVCGSLTGPTGLSGLAVRQWVCAVCGTAHERDVNSARVILAAGLGLSLKETSNGLK